MNVKQIQAREIYESWCEGHQQALVPGALVTARWRSADWLEWDNFAYVIFLDYLPEHIVPTDRAAPDNLTERLSSFIFDCRIMIVLPDGDLAPFLYDSRFLKSVGHVYEGAH